MAWRNAIVLRLVVAMAVALLTVGVGAQQMKPCDLMKLMLKEDEDEAKKGVDGFVRMGGRGALPLVCFVSGNAPGAPPATDLGKYRGEQALVKIGVGGLPVILDRLTTKDDEARARLIVVLATIRDAQREAPLTKLWASEKSDRVRGALVHATMQIHVDRAKPEDKEAASQNLEKGLQLLRERTAKAKQRELRALAIQFAMRGTDDDLQSVLQRVEKPQRKEFVTKAIAELRSLMRTALSQLPADGPPKQGLARLTSLK